MTDTTIGNEGLGRLAMGGRALFLIGLALLLVWMTR